MRPPAALLALLFTAFSSLPAWGAAPEEVLDSLQRARSAADASAFLGHLTPDAVVLGMGGSGPLSGRALQTHIDALFSRGGAGNYRRVQREFRYSPAGDVAWFSELLSGPGGGQTWESGVLIDTGGGWKVAQYTTAPVQSTLSTAPTPAVADSEAAPVQPAIPAAPVEAASTGQADGAEPASAEPATNGHGEKKRCRKRHKTNKASSC